MTTETIQINIREDGSRVVVVNMTAIANASSNAGHQVNFLNQALGRLTMGYAIVRAIKEMVEMADTVTLLDARLKLATKTTAEYAQAQADLYRIAQNNNVGLVETTKLYTKLFEPVRRLGGDLNEVSAIVDAFSTALRVGGANTQEAASAITQFTQAMNKGKLDGDEFRTMAEAAPRFMRALADGMGVATGELKGMGSQGKLTADVIGNALISQLKTLKAEASSLQNTVGGAMSDLSNDTMITVGSFDKLTGMTRMMADVVQGASLIVFELGKVFKSELADGTKVATDEFNAMSPIIFGLGKVFETLLLLGSDIVFVFKSIGREIGGIAAQITAILNRDWKGVGDIRAAMVEDAKNSLAELERYQNRVAGITDRAMAARDANKGNKGEPTSDIDYTQLKEVASTKDLTEARMRLAGITKIYFKDLATYQSNLEAGNITQKEYVELVSDLAKKTWDASAAGRSLAKAAKGNDDRLKVMQDSLVNEQTMFSREQSIFEQRDRMLDVFHDKFNLSESEYYAGRQNARAEYIASEAISYAKEKAIIESFKPRNGREVADQKLRLDRLLQDHQDFNNKMAGLRTDDELAQMSTAKAIQSNSDDAVNKYLSGQYDTLQTLKDVTAAREVSKSSIERENVAIYEQALANMRLQASLPVGVNGRTQADQDSAIAFVQFLETELNLRKGITEELEKQERFKQDNKAAQQSVKDWKAAGHDIAESLKTTFGQVGNTLGQIFKTYADSAAEQIAINRRLADSTRGMLDDDPRKVDAIKKAKLDSAKAQVKSYGDMASAAKGFFKENSRGYQVLETTEKAFRAYELAMALESMLKKVFFKETEVAANTALNATKLTGEAATTAASTGLAATEASAWGITAVVKAIASLPFPLNLAAGAATLAAVVAIGAKMFGGVGGSVSISEQRQAENGTGSVLGDKSAKSESIKRALELAAANSNIELTHTAGMLRALLSIESNISNLGSVLARGGDINTVAPAKQLGTAASFMSSTVGTFLTGGFIGLALDKLLGGWVSNTLGKIANSIFGGNISTVDVGLTANKMSLAQVRNGGITANQYSDLKEDGGWFSSDEYSTKTNGLGAQANDQFTKVITSLADSITQAADLLGICGDDFTARLDSFVVDIGKISTKDLKPEEVQEALEAAFSKVGDDMARFAVGNLIEFQKAGEGYLETLIRVASNFANVSSVFEAMGKSTDKLKSVGVTASERLVALAGGIDNFASQAASFNDNYLTEAERLAPVSAYVAREMANLGYASITSRDQFKELALSIDTTTEKGAEQFTALMALQSAFAKTHAATLDLTMSEQDIADQRKELQDQYDQLTMTTAQLRAKERLTIALTNRALYDQVKAREDLSAAYQKESESLQSTIDHISNFQKNVVSFRDSLALGAQSPLTPVERAAEAERQYNAMLIKAQAGDTNAQAGITSAASAYLTASQVINASNEKQYGIFEKVRQDMANLAASAGIQLTDAQKQLSAMEQQVAGIITLNQTALSIQQALMAVLAADELANTTIPDPHNVATPAPVLVAMQDLRADNAKLLEDNAKIIDAINTQTEAVVEATLVAAQQNAEATNEGAVRVARTRNWKLDSLEAIE